MRASMSVRHRTATLSARRDDEGPDRDGPDLRRVRNCVRKEARQLLFSRMLTLAPRELSPLAVAVSPPCAPEATGPLLSASRPMA